MGIRINGSTSGYTELVAPAVANNITLTLPDSTGSAGQALVSDGAGGMSWSAVASLDVVTAPAITGNVKINGTVTVSNPEVAGGTLPYSYTYQWQFQASGGSSYSNISGATSQTFTITSDINSVSAGGGTLQCVVTVSDSANPALTTTLTSNPTVAIQYNFLHKTTWPAGKLMYSTSNNGDFWELAPGNQGLAATDKIINHCQGNSTQWFPTLPNYTLYLGSAVQALVASTTLSAANSYHAVGNGQVVALHRGHGAGNDVAIFSNGDAMLANGSVRVAGSDPVVHLCGAAMVGHHPLLITEQGNIIFPGNGLWAGTSWAQGDSVNPLPTGVKVISAFQALGTGSNGYASAAIVILGDDGRIYMVGNSGITGFPTNGTWSAAAHCTVTDTNSDFYVGICGDLVIRNWTSEGGWAGITAEGKMAKATSTHAWGYVTDNATSQVITDFMTHPFGTGYSMANYRAIALSTQPNYLYRLDNNTPTADKYQINNLSGGAAITTANWNLLKNGIGSIATNTYTSSNYFFILPV